MEDIIHEIHSTLNKMKDFESGYTTKNPDKMIVNYKGRNYEVDFEYLGTGSIDDAVDRLR